MNGMAACRNAFGEALTELGRVNDRVVVLDADLATSTKAGLFASEFPDRFFEVGIAEQNMISMAAGLASMGFIPFTSTFACFASKRATDQARICVAQPKLHVVMTGAYSGLLSGKTGKTHQSVQDIAIFRSMPEMTVVVPGDAVETAKAVYAAAEYGRPAYLRLTRDPAPVVFDDEYEFRIGKGVSVRRGKDVAILTTGLMVSRALEACERLSEQGVDAGVLHLPTVKPLDEEAVIEVAQAGVVVTAEEHNTIGGLGSAVAELLSAERPTIVKRVGIPDAFGESAPNEDLLSKYSLTARDIFSTVMEAIEMRGRQEATGI